jgi:hypothetical protein
MCCAIAALMIAVVAAWRSLAKGALAWRPFARWAAALAAGALLAAGGSAFAAMALGHSSGGADPLRMLARHICGTPVAHLRR